MPCEYFLLIRRQRQPCLLAIDDCLSLAGQHAGRGPFTQFVCSSRTDNEWQSQWQTDAYLVQQSLVYQCVHLAVEGRQLRTSPMPTKTSYDSLPPWQPTQPLQTLHVVLSATVVHLLQQLRLPLIPWNCTILLQQLRSVSVNQLRQSFTSDSHKTSHFRDAPCWSYLG